MHHLDAARLVRLMVENSSAGFYAHAVAEEGIATRAIAESIGAALGVHCVSIASDEAPEHLPGWRDSSPWTPQHRAPSRAIALPGSPRDPVPSKTWPRAITPKLQGRSRDGRRPLSSRGRPSALGTRQNTLVEHVTKGKWRSAELSPTLDHRNWRVVIR